ncbi:PVC-type heme-binding CxxCH protein [Luteolibacter sp. Populi]|uniref:PVC-type heme-binding CxxCH protein n=1 Tax=Luteolibacter sp. Populi TaxID=3230487 RepID=UPI003466BF0A
MIWLLRVLAGTLAISVPARADEPFNTEKSATAPLGAAQAAADWKLPPGFRATAFASEPDVRQPIAMCLDDRGRAWVAESYMYAGHSGGYYEPKLRDRIIILEDTNHDGVHDKRTVFADGLERLTSVQVGLGGVWALSLPDLVFFPDLNRDDVPDGPRVALLDGFDIKGSAHTMANGLRWGPDGWLYGRQGILAHSLLGQPGTALADRKKLNGGIWRYHPARKSVEIVAEGTTNPWGMDWDEHGEPFMINTVIGHLWHVIPGAHYKRMFGDDYSPYIFGQIDQHADHVHWDTAEKWDEVRQGISTESSSAGGGHAHTGLMIYLGDNWPEEYRGNLFTINFHGRRLNREFLEAGGSGFTGRHGPDLAFSADPWFRGIDLLYGPDGSVFVSDWSDTGECHDDDGIHRQSGRIYKISYGTPAVPAVPDVAALSPEQLLPLLAHRNEWFARRAQLALQDHAARGGATESIVPALQQQLESGATATLKLRALWALHAIGKADRGLLLRLLGDPAPPLRIWAIRLLLDDPAPASVDANTITALTQLATKEGSPAVRLALASGLQRLPLPARAGVAAPLLGHAEDAQDHNLPLMLWYGIEPLAGSHRAGLAGLAKTCAIPLVRNYIARRLAMDPADPEQAFDSLVQHAVPAPDEWKRDLLAGLAKSLEGSGSPRSPASWPQLSEVLAKTGHPELVKLYRLIGTLYRDPAAIAANRAIAGDEGSGMEARKQALRSLTAIRDPGSLELAKNLIGKPGLTAQAIERLTLEEDTANAIFLIQRLSTLEDGDKTHATTALISRAAWASLLLDAIESGSLPGSVLTPFQVRQIRSLDAPALSSRITTLWGEVRDTSAGKAEALQQWKLYLTPKTLSRADKPKGKEAFRQLCASCHKMYGEGGMVGPELTGGGRDNLDYLLSNILDPGATVAKENQLSLVTLKDGRVLAGMIRAKGERSTEFQTLTEKVSLATEEITKIETLPNSLMPEGMIDSLPREQVRDLVAWLMDKGAASAAMDESPLPPTLISLAGDWKIAVTVPGGATATLDIAAPVYQEVRSERFAGLPLYNPNGGGWNNGAKFAGNLAEACSTPDLVDTGSVILRSSEGADAAIFTRGKDWEIEPSWGTFGRLEGGALSGDAAVFASYRHTFLRIDSVVRMPDGSTIVIQGDGAAAAPVPPALPADGRLLGNVWIPGPIAKLGEEHLFPILEARYPATPPALTVAKRFPKLMEKLRAGEPVRILAWGDSVTAGVYLPPAERWQEQFAARLRAKYPQAKIDLVSAAWGGRTTTAYLNEPPGSEHNYQAKVLGAKPDLVISEFVNDAGLTAPAYEGAYRRIYDDFRSIGAEWIILTPHYVRPSWMGLQKERDIDEDPRPYVAFLRKLPEQYPVLIADGSARYGRLWRQGIPYTSLMVNSINHPNARGMKIFADALEELFPEP